MGVTPFMVRCVLDKCSDAMLRRNKKDNIADLFARHGATVRNI